MSELPRLYLITTRRRIAGPSLLEALDEAFRAGARLAALREPDLPAAELLSFAERATRLARARGARLLVNDRIDVALAAGADGVHLRASSLPVAAARRLVGAALLVGVSTHAPEEVRAAAAAGADFVVFGPVFATPDKARYRPPQGLGALAAAARAARSSRVPLFAIGGVTPERVRDCLAAGAYGVAVMGGVFAATSIRSRVGEYLAALETRAADRPRTARRGRRV